MQINVIMKKTKVKNNKRTITKKTRIVDCSIRKDALKLATILASVFCCQRANDAEKLLKSSQVKNLSALFFRVNFAI